MFPSHDLEGEDGNFYKTSQKVTWPLDGLWNLDIRTGKFESYIEQLNIIADDIDEFRSNL